MKKLQPSQRLVVEKMTLSFGKWMRGGALYRPELVDNLETCPSAAACEILSQQSPPEPLCQIYTFGVEEAEEARLQ